MDLRSYGRFRVLPFLMLKFFSLPWSRKIKLSEPDFFFWSVLFFFHADLSGYAPTLLWRTDPGPRGCVHGAVLERAWSHGKGSPPYRYSGSTTSVLLLDNQHEMHNWRKNAKKNKINKNPYLHILIRHLKATWAISTLLTLDGQWTKRGRSSSPWAIKQFQVVELCGMWNKTNTWRIRDHLKSLLDFSLPISYQEGKINYKLLHVYNCPQKIQNLPSDWSMT